MKATIHYLPENTVICSEEEIKEGNQDWILCVKNGHIFRTIENFPLHYSCKKIILSLHPLEGVPQFEFVSEEEELAIKFHTLYELYAPLHGYKTKEESAVYWDKVPKKNKQLMIAVCETILKDNPNKWTDEDMMDIAGWMAAADYRRPIAELKEEAEEYMRRKRQPTQVTIYPDRIKAGEVYKVFKEDGNYIINNTK